MFESFPYYENLRCKKMHKARRRAFKEGQSALRARLKNTPPLTGRKILKKSLATG